MVESGEDADALSPLDISGLTYFDHYLLDGELKLEQVDSVLNRNFVFGLTQITLGKLLIGVLSQRLLIDLDT